MLIHAGLILDISTMLIIGMDLSLDFHLLTTLLRGSRLHIALIHTLESTLALRACDSLVGSILSGSRHGLISLERINFISQFLLKLIDLLADTTGIPALRDRSVLSFISETILRPCIVFCCKIPRSWVTS